MPKIKTSGKDPPLSNRQLENEDIADDLVVENDVEGHDETVAMASVKMKLNTFSDNNLLNGKIRSIVLNMNQLLGEAYAFANFHILRTLNMNETCPTIDRNFYYRCLVAVSVSKSRDGTLGSEIKESKVLFDKLRDPSIPKINITGHVQIVADLSISMSTMATNHLWMNIQKRMQRFLRWSQPTMKQPMRKRIVESILFKPAITLCKLFPNKDIKNTEGLAVATELRELLKLPSSNQYASRAHLLLPLYFHILKKTATAKEAKAHIALIDGKRQKKFGGKTFTLLPLKDGFTINHIPFSSMALLGILKGMKLEKFNGDGRDEDASAILKKYFHVQLVETEKRKFRNRFVTDGVSVSVLVNKKCALVCPDSCPCEKRLKELYKKSLLDQNDKEHVRVVAVDPGFTDVATTADNNDNIKSYSSAKYYDKALYDLSRRRTNKWNKGTVELTKAIPYPETDTMSEFEEFVRMYLKNLPVILRHRYNKGYRNMRFLRYKKKQAAIREICEMIAPTGEVSVIGYGDWNGGNGSPISRRCAGPQQEIKLYLSKKKDAVLLSIDEYCSSKMCCQCHNVLSNMRAKSIIYKKDANGVKTQVERGVGKIHKILHCKSRQADSSSSKKSRCGTTWNRDVNAAKNILMLTLRLMQGLRRPAVFTRSVRLSK